MTHIPTVLEQIEADLREAMSTTGTGMYVTAYPEQLAQLVEVAKAAQRFIRYANAQETGVDDWDYEEEERRYTALESALAPLLAPADNTDET